MSAHLGPLGGLVPFRASSEEITPEQRASYQLTMGGKRKAQWSPTQARIWQVGLEAGTPSELGRLSGLVQGLYGPPPWCWVSPWAQVTNLFTPGTSLLRAGTWTGSAVHGGPITLDDGSTPAQHLMSSDGAQVFYGDDLPVVPGVEVTASVWAVGQGRVGVELRFYDRARQQLSTIASETDAPAGSPLIRCAATATPPARAAYCRLVIAGALRSTQPAFSWTPRVSPWTVGNGAPRVVAEGLNQSVLAAVRDVPGMRRSTINFTIQEVGNA